MNDHTHKPGLVRWRAVVLCLAALLGPATASGRAATLTEDGVSRATIRVETDPTEATVAAVRELAHYLERISGAQVPVVSAGEPVETPAVIYVGLDHADLERAFPDVELAVPRFDEVLIVVRGDHVLIAGHDDKANPASPQHGTSQAIYTFIEQHLGVRWLWPGELGEDVPAQPTIRLDDVVFRYAPPLEQRYLRILRYHDFEDSLAHYPGRHADAREIGLRLNELSYDWRRRQRCDYDWVKAGHAFTEWWEKYHATHPEYFALMPDGTRSRVTPPDRIKLCISNPAVADQWFADAVEQLEADPTLRLVSISPNDNSYEGFCVCENCKAWDTTDPTALARLPLRWGDKGPPAENHVALTDRYARFWNLCARRIKERYPDREVYLGTWAYQAYRTPPVEVELEDNIIVGYIGSLPAYPRSRHADELKNWQGWSEQTDYLLWRPNLFYADRGMPVLFMRRAADDFAWLADHSMKGLDLDIVYGHWALQGLQYYLIAKHAWNPYLDLDEALDDYTTRAFGKPAAPFMRQYFELLEAIYYERVEAAEEQSKLERITSLPDFYSPQRRERLQALLDQARRHTPATAQGDLHRRRIDFFQVGHDFLDLHLNAIAAMNRLRDATDDEREAAYQAAVEAARLRDALLDDQMDSVSLNTTWGFLNWGPTRAIDNCYGPPSEAQRQPRAAP